GPPRPRQRRGDDAVLRGLGEEAHEDARGRQDLGGRAGPGRLRQLRREGINRVLFELVPAMSVFEGIFEFWRAAERITKDECTVSVERRAAMEAKRKGQNSQGLTTGHDVYEVRPRKGRDGVDLISDRFRCGPIWYAGPDAVRNAVAYAKYRSL